MEGWEKRLLEEKQDLDTKIRKLDAFFKDTQFQELGTYQQLLLVKQFLVMQEYASILALRIES